MICHAEEIAAARVPHAAKFGYLRQDWDNPQEIHGVTGEHDLFDDDKIILVPVPGHTPGSIAALVNLDRDGSFLLASDAIAMRSPLENGIMPKNTCNADQAWASFTKIKRIAAAGATVICGHDDAQSRSLRKGADSYE